MSWLQIVNAIIIYSWLFSVLILLWIHAIRSGRRQESQQYMLAESAAKSANAALQSSEAALKASDAVRSANDATQKLADITHLMIVEQGRAEHS